MLHIPNLLRAKGKMTQRELAEKTGIAEAPLSDYIRGKKTPMPRAIARLAEALDVDYEVLCPPPKLTKEVQAQHDLILKAARALQTMQMEPADAIERYRTMVEAYVALYGPVHHLEDEDDEGF